MNKRPEHRWLSSYAPLNLRGALAGLLLCATPLLLAGCGQGPGYPSATLSGVVTLDGVRIEKGSITFYPAAATGAGSGGSAEITNGEYVVENVPLGTVSFTFSALVKTGRMVEDLGRQVPEQVNPIPVRYREEGIDREIAKSGNQDFELIGGTVQKQTTEK